MKSKVLIPFVAVVFFVTTYGAEKAAKDAKQPTSAEKKGASGNAAVRNEDIAGEWEMLGFVVDTNDNLQIDEAERNALKKPSFKDYMKLNRDGTGEFTIAKMPGRFELTDQGSGGRKFLNWYDKANGRHRIGTILKVTRDELHIKEPGGHGMFIWKRL